VTGWFSVTGCNSRYTDEVSLAGALSLDAIQTYAKQATGGPEDAER